MLDFLGWLAVGLCLMLVLEGLFPFAAPARYREYLLKLAECSDAQLRFIGLTLSLTGLLLLWFFK